LDNLKEEDIIKKINRLLKDDKDLVLIEKTIKEGNYFKGKLEVNYLEQVLNFDFAIPHNYPLTHPNSDNISIIFKNRNYIGLNHINPDGSVCFHPDKDDDFDRKLIYEIECLKQWIRDYYIYKKEDDNYAYLIHNTESGCINKLYFTNTKNNFSKNSFGTFRFSIFSDEKFGDKKFPVKKMFRLGFEGGQNDSWSNTFIKGLKENGIKKGLYYYIKDEPLTNSSLGRKAIENWDELKDYLSDEFIEKLYLGLNRDFSNNFYHENSLFLIIGYKIPNNENYEEHWDLIRIPKKNIPIDSVKIPKDELTNPKIRFEHILKKNKINWGTTENIDYSRFFGRGKLDNKITNSNILIIGCGAIGSSLSEILVRGGTKNIILMDFDSTKGGNLCRANYELKDMIFPKTNGLIDRLKSISPFVDLAVEYDKLNKFDLKILGDVFNKKLDIIFDCSTDTEVTYIIDKLNFRDCKLNSV